MVERPQLRLIIRIGGHRVWTTDCDGMCSQEARRREAREGGLLLFGLVLQTAKVQTRIMRSTNQAL